jgi:branched-chain amino acid aminotransferase
MMQTAAAMSRFDCRINPAPTSPTERARLLADPGFGRYHSDHMVSLSWTAQRGWHGAQLRPYEALSMDPMSLVLHYAQAVFEGLKAYRHADGSIHAFRPQMNARRLNASAERLALPAVPEDLFIESLRQLAQVDHAWVPSEAETSLYFRPFLIADEAFLGVRSAERVAYHLVASPAGSYFPSGVKPVPVWVSTRHSRAGRGGTGFAKCAGNYAGSLAALAEARSHGCPQALFLDASESRYLEEMAGMNVFIVQRDGTIATPELGDSILPGVTRASLIELARAEGHRVEERRIALDEVLSGFADGSISEIFGCGTAAVIFPVSGLRGPDFAVDAREPRAGEVTMKLRRVLTDLQYGRSRDDRGWLMRLV